MSVYKMKDKPHGKPRKNPWRAVVPQGNGRPPLIKHFLTEEEADEWEAARRKDKRMEDVPDYRKRQELNKLKDQTVRDLIRCFLKEKEQTIAPNEKIFLQTFMAWTICNKSLIEVLPVHVRQYINARLKQTSRMKGEPISPRTVRWEVSRFGRIFEWAKDNLDGYSELKNPTTGIRIDGSTGGRRERSLEKGELEKLEKACEQCLGLNKFYVPLAIYLAIDTGMRLQEIFNLTWNDVDMEKRRITIRKSKTDKQTGNRGATIVLPARAGYLLNMLALCLRPEIPAGFADQIPKVSDEDCIFPMTERAFTQSFADLVKRAGLWNADPQLSLHFHDLRRTANTRFILAGLTQEERNIQLRHTDKSMNAVYIGRNFLLEKIQEKLDDKYGFTEQEDNFLTRAGSSFELTDYRGFRKLARQRHARN